jgi:hypothetical protein
MKSKQSTWKNKQYASGKNSVYILGIPRGLAGVHTSRPIFKQSPLRVTHVFHTVPPARTANTYTGIRCFSLNNGRSLYRHPRKTAFLTPPSTVKSTRTSRTRARTIPNDGSRKRIWTVHYVGVYRFSWLRDYSVTLGWP